MNESIDVEQLLWYAGSDKPDQHLSYHWAVTAGKCKSHACALSAAIPSTETDCLLMFRTGGLPHKPAKIVIPPGQAELVYLTEVAVLSQAICQHIPLQHGEGSLGCGVRRGQSQPLSRCHRRVACLGETGDGLIAGMQPVKCLECSRVSQIPQASAGGTSGSKGSQNSFKPLCSRIVAPKDESQQCLPAVNDAPRRD